MAQNNSLRFTGHDTFYCRNFWLKKGLNHLWNEKSLTDDYAVVDLGVGKNMLSAIRYWLQAFGLVDDNEKPNEFAEFIFDDEKGCDPYLEDIASLWFLHYLLVTERLASLYYFVFNHFRKQRIEFQPQHLIDYLNNKVKQSDNYVHPSSVKKDVRVFINNYLLPKKSKGPEDDFARLLHELNLLQRVEGSKDWYKIVEQPRTEIPYQLILYIVCNNLLDGESITIKQLTYDENSIGSVFAMNERGVVNKVRQMVKKHPDDIVFKDDGGVSVLQINESLDYKTIMKEYYAG